MVYIVEMCEYPVDRENKRLFSCHGSTWFKILDIAKKYGWIPKGTVLPEDASKYWEEYGKFEDTYEPEEWAYCKAVSEEDANNLADALERALGDINDKFFEGYKKPPVPIIVEDFDGTSTVYKSGISEKFLREFIQYLREGAFCFAWDD